MSISPPLLESDSMPGGLRERRQHERRKLLLPRPVTITFGRNETGVLLDVSEAGMRVHAWEAVRPGAILPLHFDVPDRRQRIDATGRICWTADAGQAGVAFVSLGAESRMRLLEWMSRLDAQAARAPAPEAVPAADIAAIEREIATLDEPAALRHIVARARACTAADGAAIALTGSEGIVCRASAGNAPEVGVRLRPESGLSGECLRSGAAVRCDDSELDTRVDREACRALNLRSVLVVPVTMSEVTVIGLVEIFSARARAFSARETAVVVQLAALVARTVSRSPADLRPQPGVIASDGDSAGMILCDLCGHQNLPGARDCAQCDVPLPQALRREPLMAAIPALHSEDIAELRKDMSAGVAHRGKTQAASLPRAMLAMIILLLGCVGGVAAYQHWRVRPTSSPSGSISPDDLQPIVPSPPAASQPAAQRANGAPPQPAVAKASPAHAASTSKPRQSAQPEDAVMIWKSPEGRAPAVAPEANNAVPPPAPATLGGGTDTPVSAMLASPVQPPALKTDRSLGVTPLKLIRRVTPEYPTLARARGLYGAVVLRATISVKGTVDSVHVQSGDPMLAEAAVRAVRQWRYRPQELNGRPISAETLITVNFAR